ncbi:MAG: ABC transporter ATP-binding protein, partial [Planctomycetes bacterium]|nr:ABC transporter ATP-binding protein [Planctomycetota bacterium]
MGKDLLLSVRDLSVCFSTEEGDVRAVNDVSFDIGKGRTVALVGESGCGKSVTALSILRLIPQPPGEIVSGEVFYGKNDLLKANENRMRAIRGNHIAMIFQEPMTSLNPVFTVGYQIREIIELHEGLGKEAVKARTVEMLELVGIPDARKRLDDYPHQFSGGMRQRAMIAMA